MQWDCVPLLPNTSCAIYKTLSLYIRRKFGISFVNMQQENLAFVVVNFCSSDLQRFSILALEAVRNIQKSLLTCNMNCRFWLVLTELNVFPSALAESWITLMMSLTINQSGFVKQIWLTDLLFTDFSSMRFLQITC